MKKRDLICVICPNGCQLEADIEEKPSTRVLEVRGNLCEKGIPWAEQEITNPMRTIASSILVDGGDMPLVSVRTDAPVPLKSIHPVMDAIKSLRAKPPVRIGDIMIHHPAGTDCNIIATRHVNPA